MKLHVYEQERTHVLLAVTSALFLLASSCVQAPHSATPVDFDEPGHLLPKSSLLPADLMEGVRDVKAHRLTYSTSGLKGEQIVASAAVILPGSENAKGLVCYVRGTLLPSESASSPSFLRTGSPFDDGRGLEILKAATAFASCGFVVVLPDLIGYGASDSVPHPYMVTRYMASSSNDAIRATRMQCAKILAGSQSRLFLAGYSQGASAGMALHRHLEAEGIRVTASSLLAGVYATQSTISRYMSTDSEHPASNLYAWAVYNFNLHSGDGRAIDHILKPKVARRFSWDLPASIPGNPRLAVRDEVREAVLRDMNHAITMSLKANDCYAWVPKAPILLHHGTADDVAPFFNSQIAFDKMSRHGGPVTLVPYLGMDHSEPFEHYLRSTCRAFLTMTAEN